MDPAESAASLDYSQTGLSPADAVQYIIFSFEGISDPTVLAVIKSNTAALDTYRIAHTFRYSLVNRYVLSYSQTNNRISIQTPSLNTSLTNLLNTQYGIFLTQQLNFYKISADQYNSLASLNSQTQSVLQSMYDDLQVNFAKYFAVNYGTYSKLYFTNLSNSMLIQDGINAANVIKSYSPANALTPRDTDVLQDFRLNPPNYWPKMTGLVNSVEGPPRNMGGSNAFPNGSNYPYNIYQGNIDLNFDEDLTKRFIDTTDFMIYTDDRRQAGDILIDVEAGKYTIFQFRSKYRQTLQVETLPRQTTFRYPAWNKNNPVEYPIQTLFDLSYSYIVPADLTLSNITPYTLTYNTIPGGWSNLINTDQNFGITQAQSRALWGSTTEQLNITIPNGLFYIFQTPSPNNTANDLTTYNLNLTIETPDGENFPSDLFVFLYHDIAAFSADLSPAGLRNENPINYKQQIILSKSASSTSYKFKTYANQQYYLLVRSSNVTYASTSYRILPWFPDGSVSTPLYTNTDFDSSADPATMLSNWHVAKNNDPAFIRLPVTPSNLWLSNTTDQAINQFQYLPAVPIGYDINGVSTDLTDYVPFSSDPTHPINLSANIRADPITNYVFTYSSAYNQLNGSYFGPGSTNSLVSEFGAATYSPATVLHKQYKMVNYTGNTYIQDDTDNTSPYIAPYDKTTTTNGAIAGYTYDDAANDVIRLDGGVCGFLFLPGAGTWAIEQISFKCNYINPAADPNLSNVHMLAVYYTSEVQSRSLSYLNINTALAICLRTGSSTYSNDNTLNLGFDSSLGTYYTFSNYPQLVTRNPATSVISGFNQVSQKLIHDINSYYSIIAYTFTQAAYANWSNYMANNLDLTQLAIDLSTTNISRIRNIVGTPIPYPYAYQAYTSNTFYDGKTAPTGRGMVLSTSTPNLPLKPEYGPAPGNDFSVVQYEQSLPYVNTNIHFLVPQDIIFNPSAFNAWADIPTSPSYIHASVPNYMLFQDGAFTLSTYNRLTVITITTPADRIFTTVGGFTIQQIYPDSENTSLIAVSGNNTEYCFLGATPTQDPNISQLRFKIYDPATGILTTLPQNPNYVFSNSLLLQHFVFHDTRRWFITSSSVTENKIILQGADIYQPTGSQSYTQRVYTNSVGSELQMDPAGTNLYLSLLTPTTTGFTTMTAFNFVPTDTIGYVGSNTAGYTVALQTLIDNLPPYYTQLSISVINKQEQILLMNNDLSPSSFFGITKIYEGAVPSQSNTFITQSIYNIKDAAQNLVSPTRIIGGAYGSRWLLFSGQNLVMGNRNDAYDAPTSLNTAWQIFFPVLKIQMDKLANGYSPILDLTNIEYPEWPHTAIFAYKDLSNMVNDMKDKTNSAKYKWGNESKQYFLTNDVKFNGFYFNGYVANIPLMPNYDGGNSNTDYYLAIRGWLPTEQFQTMLRFYLPNRYDFGYIRMLDLVNEIQIGSVPANQTEFNPRYLSDLLTFNSNYTFSQKSFGMNITTGFPGVKLDSTGFGDFMAQYNGYYSTLSTNVQILQNIQSNLAQDMNAFLASDLKYILPASALTRQNFTASLLFQIQWNSQLTPAYRALPDQWGLGWNMGFTKQDTGFSTTFTGASFYQINQGFIYLRLNPEFNINRMDAGAKENYSQTREPSGITNQYYCKLLLTSFGGNATTFIHNPIEFTPPINRLSKLQFQWIGADGVVINNNDAEWDMTVNITERIDMIPAQQKTVKFFTNVPFASVRNDTSTQFGDELPDNELDKLSEPEE